MESMIEQYAISFPIFILIFCRMAGLFIMSPIFGRQNLPTYWKIMFSVFLSYIVFSFDSFDTIIEIESFLHLAIYAIKEFFLGFILGYITTMLFSAILLAGQLIDTQIGFGMVNILDPQNNIQVPLLGNFNNMIALLLFLILDGHHTLISFLISSIDIVPVGRVVIDPDVYRMLIVLFYKAFELAFKISLPIIGAALVTEGALGLLSRSISQINIFAIGIPGKILIGLITLFFFMPMFMLLLEKSFAGMFADIKALMEVMAGQ